MKTTSRLWSFLKRNWDVILTMVIAAVIAPLSYLQKIESQIISAAILSVLFLIAISLLVSRETNSRLQETSQGILDRMQKPSIDEIITPYDEWMKEIGTNLGSAKEVWILSRTCSRLWEDYGLQLKGALDKKGSIRLMLVSPENGALQMIANSVVLERARDLLGKFPKVTSEDYRDQYLLWKERVNDFMNYIRRLSSNYDIGHLDLRCIDYLPAHTLIIINPTSEHGIMFAELGTYHANGRKRPTLSIQKQKDKFLYSLFFDEYNAMWDSAHAGVEGNHAD